MCTFFFLLACYFCFLLFFFFFLLYFLCVLWWKQKLLELLQIFACHNLGPQTECNKTTKPPTTSMQCPKSAKGRMQQPKSHSSHTHSYRPYLPTYISTYPHTYAKCTHNRSFGSRKVPKGGYNRRIQQTHRHTGTQAHRHTGTYLHALHTYIHTYGKCTHNRSFGSRKVPKGGYNRHTVTYKGTHIGT